jgi:phenylalanyl-tRNA synthetase beta chain
MGAANSSINPQTTRILLHSPIIDPKIIRKTTKQLGFMTEAANRYERLVDWGMAQNALERAWYLIQKESTARLVEAFDTIYQKPAKQIIKITAQDIQKTLGVEIKSQQAKDYLTRLGFTVSRSGEKMEVQVPTWRTGDVKYPVDIVEEIARINGYYQIPKTPLPQIAIKVLKNSFFILKSKIATWLVDQGFQEVLTPTFVSGEEVRLAGFRPEDQYTVQSSADNPQLNYLRPSMIITVAKVLVRNNWYGQLKLFEIGETFANKKEQTMVCLAQTGNQQKQWSEFIPESDIQIITPDHPFAKHIKLRTTVTFVETDIETLTGHVKAVKIIGPKLVKINYRPYSRFTPIVRDIALIIDESTNAEEIRKVIASIDQRIFLVDLFDEFQSEKFGPGKISRAFHVIFDDLQSSIPESEVGKIWNRVVKIVQSKGWVIRE